MKYIGCTTCKFTIEGRVLNAVYVKEGDCTLKILLCIVWHVLAMFKIENHIKSKELHVKSQKEKKRLNFL